ncbi:MAG: molybdenum cofactor biosynthesis protein MoaE [Chlamydiae bacterium]|nr:molybdenum cofactor biosynthesis protein MoaE [Chlamydiota bacterium]
MENFKFQISNFKFITQEPIRLEKVLRTSIPLSCGAMVLFIGIVRNHDEGKSVQKLFYECYPEMAEKEIHSIIEQAQKNFSVEDVRVVHRIVSLPTMKIQKSNTNFNDLSRSSCVMKVLPIVFFFVVARFIGQSMQGAHGSPINGATTK